MKLFSTYFFFLKKRSQVILLNKMDDIRCELVKAAVVGDQKRMSELLHYYMALLGEYERSLENYFYEE